MPTSRPTHGPTALAEELGIRIGDADMTAYPWWAIVRRSKKGRPKLICGVWLSREAAEEELRLRAYDYPEDAYVYAFSGCYSKDWQAVCGALRQRLDGRHGH